MLKKLSAIRPNVVNILILITADCNVQNQLVSERITCKSRPTNEKIKENFARLWSPILFAPVARTDMEM